MTAKNYSLVAICVTVLASAFGGCTCLTKHSSASQTLPTNDWLRIMEIVLRDMGESAGQNRLCLLDLNDAEFAELNREFISRRPNFQYAQANKTRSAENSVVLQVKLSKLGSTQASVIATYVTGNNFSEFEYELVYDGSSWKIVSKQFVMGS